MTDFRPESFVEIPGGLNIIFNYAAGSNFSVCVSLKR